MAELAGKAALITGAARGQGAAEARCFVAAGARVVLTDVNVRDGQALADELGDVAVFLRHDVSQEHEWDTVVTAAEDAFGALDVLVNNAAIHTAKPLVAQPAEEFERMLRINLVGAFHGMKAVVDPMRRRGGGSIVNISSQAGMQGLSEHSAYGASKWGLRGITKTAAIELGEFGIRVNSVHPGAIDTPMIEHLGLGHGTGSHPGAPLGRVGTPEEVAALVAFLASDASKYITGGEFTVDGGASAGKTRNPSTTSTR